MGGWKSVSSLSQVNHRSDYSLPHECRVGKRRSPFTIDYSLLTIHHKQLHHMFIIENYSIAVLFCIVTMICWGSWANTQKLAGRTWRFELFYWDYVLGIVIFSLLSAYTLGSIGEKGRSFAADLSQVSTANITS